MTAAVLAPRYRRFRPILFDAERPVCEFCGVLTRKRAVFVIRRRALCAPCAVALHTERGGAAR